MLLFSNNTLLLFLQKLRPSFIYPELATHPLVYGTLGYDDFNLIQSQSLLVSTMAEILLQVMVHGLRNFIIICWSFYCSTFTWNQDFERVLFNFTKTETDSKPIRFSALFFDKDFNAIAFPAPRHVISTVPNWADKSTQVLDTDITVYTAIIQHSYQLNEIDHIPDIYNYSEEEEIPVLTQDEYETEEDDDLIIIPSDQTPSHPPTYTAYKRVDKKIHPVSTQFPLDYQVRRQIPSNPLIALSPLPTHPPEFVPTPKISQERMKLLNVNPKGFLWPEEEKLFQYVMKLNEAGIAFEDVERGTLKEEYFSPYIIPTIPHTPWEYRNIPIPPGLMPKVLEVLKLKIAAGVYEQSQSSYRSRWFVVLKKSGKLRIVHDLQPLNGVTIRDAGMLPIVDDFIEGFTGRQCYTVFDLFWGFDARKIHPRSRDLTAFMTPLGLLQITSLPTGFTNSPAEFQKCMVMVLQDEIPHVANIFIDDLPIKGPNSQYLDADGNPELIPENPGIHQFIWEHAQDIHQILHRIHQAGATVSAHKAQISLPEVLIVGQLCNAQGREPDRDKVNQIEIKSARSSIGRLSHLPKKFVAS